MILDTLKSRGVQRHVLRHRRERRAAHLPLLRRIVDEGHAIGNHTFTHPNLALHERQARRSSSSTPPSGCFEAVLGRRTAFFRPPYFGDAEPTTLDELVPAQIAKERGYSSSGLHIDAEDWQSPGVQTIIDTVLAQRISAATSCCCTTAAATAARRSRRSARSSTRCARVGDTVVPLSQLVGITRDQAMPRRCRRAIALARAR